MKVSKFITTAALLSMAFAVSACNGGGGGGGGGGGNTSQAGTSEAGTSQGGTSQAGTSEAGTSQGGGSATYNFEFWSGFGHDYTNKINEIVKIFNERNSDVHIEHTSKGDYDSLQSQIIKSVSTKTFPNIACGYPDHFAEYWNQGILVPLNDYIEKYNEEHNINLIDDYYSAYMKENMEIAYDDGEPIVVGLPYNKSTEVVLANGYYFDFFHSKDERIVVPETWDQLKTITPYIYKVVQDYDLYSENSKYLIGKINEATNVAYDFRISATDTLGADEEVLQELSQISNEKQFFALGYDSSENAFITILHQWGIDYTKYTAEDFERDGIGKALFWNNDNKEATKNALKFFQDLKAAHGFGVPETFGESLFCTAALEQGRCLFTIGSSGGLNKPAFENKRLDIHPMIYKDAAHKAVISQGTSLGLLNRYTSADPDAYEKEMYQAFSAMVELTRGELQARWVTPTGYFPASKSAYDHQIYQDLLNDDDPSRLMKLYRDAGQINTQVYDKDGDKWDKFVDPGFVGSNSIRVVVGDIIHAMTTGTNPGMDEIVKAVDAAWAKLDNKVK